MHFPRPVLLLTLLTWPCAGASGQVSGGILIGADTDPFDQLGLSCAIAGSRAVLGAFGNDPGGAAYVFESQGVGSFTQVAKLTPQDLAPDDQFGYAVAISSERVLVGSTFDDDFGPGSGSAYIFEHNGLNWAQVAKLLPSDGATADTFGNAVAIEGNFALVGAVEEDAPLISSGAAYLFERNGSGIWNQVAKFKASPDQSGARFGHAVALSGQRAIVGARQYDGAGSDSGAAYIFERNGSGVWVQAAQLLASDGVASQLFGGSVDILGDRAIVGAEGPSGTGSGNGATYVYERSASGVWLEVDKLNPDSSASATNVRSCALDHGRILFGVPGELASPSATKRGSAYLFERTASGQWVKAAKMETSTLDPFGDFGLSVDLSGEYALVGSRSDDTAGSTAGLAEAFYYPSSSALPTQISVGAGGVQKIRVDLPTSDANKIYFLLGSATGTAPGASVDGLTVPLVFDNYLLFTLQHPNTPPLGSSLGLLNSIGDASATLTIAAGTNPALAGAVLYHSALVVEPSTLEVTAVTAFTSLLLVP